MLSPDEKYRYSRQITLGELGLEGQQNLKQSSVLIVGVGGLGCPVAQYLTAAGIGRIGLADHDEVKVHNLHRQILFGESNLGQNKAEAAAQRLQDLNPHVELECHTNGYLATNAETLTSSYDLVVDCTDNFGTRYLINDWCGHLHKPLVYGGVDQYEGQVSVFHLPQGSCYRSLFPQPPDGRVMNCAEKGVLGMVPGMVGLKQANEVVKCLLNWEGLLDRKVWVMDSRSNEVHVWNLQPSTWDYSERPDNHLADIDPRDTRPVISWKEAEDWMIGDSWTLCDVRETHEKKAWELPEHMHIPLSEWDHRIEELGRYDKLLFVCQSGVRSFQAVQRWLATYPNKQGMSIAGGVAERTLIIK